MKILTQLTVLREETRGLTRDERARRCCEAAKKFEKIGEYETACEALSEFWPERDAHLNLDELDEATRAEVLLRAGALSGWLGATDQVAGGQETAKNLITKSIEIFEGLDQTHKVQSHKVAEAQGDLALCYWREGSYDEARIRLENALYLLGDDDSDLRAVLLIRAGIVEVWSQRLNEALYFYNQAASLLDRSKDHAVKGSLHNEFGLVFKHLADPENRADYLDRSLMEYTAASFHFEMAGNIRYLSGVEINLGSLFFKIGKYQEAHKHLDRARHFFTVLKDIGMIAKVDDTRARTLLAEGRVAEAERVARYAVHLLDRGDEQATLAGALTTYAVAIARLANYSLARSTLQRAISIAETVGDRESAGRAKLSIIEELYGQTPDTELAATFLSAAELLGDTQDPSTTNRLMSCASKMVKSLSAEPAEVEAARVTSWEGFAFKEAVHKTERAIIERALKDAGGLVSRASLLLGFKHHQSLISIINLRHPELLPLRSAIVRKRVPLSKRPKRGRPRKARADADRRPAISILYVKDNEKPSVIGELLGAEGWQVDLCTDSFSAFKKVAGRKHYDLMLIDNDMSGLNGLALVSLARSARHRGRTPIVVVSGPGIESAAWGAGVDEFLRKPDEVPQVPATIARLLKIRLKGSNRGDERGKS